MLRALLGLALILSALAIPMSCSGTAERVAQVSHIQGQLEATLAELETTQAALADAMAAPAGETTEEQVAGLHVKQAALLENMRGLGDALHDALEGMPGAWAADFEAWKGGQGPENLVGGVLSLGGAQGGLIGIGSTILLSLWRDRRKRQGGDPLQLEHVPTPPTTG
jgi:uncharacterized protein YukE